jgi:hypothetical protein
MTGPLSFYPVSSSSRLSSRPLSYAQLLNLSSTMARTSRTQKDNSRPFSQESSFFFFLRNIIELIRRGAEKTPSTITR